MQNFKFKTMFKLFITGTWVYDVNFERGVCTKQVHKITEKVTILTCQAELTTNREHQNQREPTGYGNIIRDKQKLSCELDGTNSTQMS